MSYFRTQFYSLSGKFMSVKTENFPTLKDALAAVKTYAEAQGFTAVKIADERCADDCDGYRITARTPNGRNGRNVAQIDEESDYSIGEKDPTDFR